LAHKNRTGCSAIWTRIDAGYHGAPGRRGPAAEIPGERISRREQAWGSGNLGTDIVAKAAPDGSTLGVSIGGSLAINTLLFSRLPYDPRKDIAPVTQLVTQPSVLAVTPELGISSVTELVALLKKKPGKYNFASIRNGSLSHLAMEAIAMKAGTQLVHVPYASSPQAITAVIRNDAQMACLPAISVTPQAAAGTVKILPSPLPGAHPICRMCRR
jgi:tripartite-type tricarboxylate transporter receptor subunit TctC